MKQEGAARSAERAGFDLVAVDHEDKLSQVDVETVELVLVAGDWPRGTLQRLREMGVSRPFILVSPNPDDEASYAKAKELGCVDVVSYPLPMEYLKRWIPPIEQAGTNPAAPPPDSPLEAILKRHGPSKSGLTRISPQTALPSDDPEPPIRGRVVCIHSAKGGVGKSTVTALLARALSRAGVSVGVIDLDPKGNLQAIHHRPAAMTTDDFARLPFQMDKAAFKDTLVEVDGWYLLPSGRARDGIDEGTIRRVVGLFGRYFDFTLIDTSPSASTTYSALELADRVVFVMTPEWMAFRRFLEEYELVRHLKTPERVAVAVNRIRKNVSEHRRALRLLEEANVPSEVVYIPEDRQLYRDLMAAAPLGGSRKVADAVEHLLGALRVVPVSKRPRRAVRFRSFREVK
ncbi:Cobyrinic acid ac-diamide synthase [Alicyclobacillus hesperidum URH17-3-68]|uniref:ParA family protein n=1 Tax=Alicyclobacillus hesperidum TaxID=89784 RepID=UPI000281C3B1|nr:MinD/ParA family protein [Alicyclobacillus hesperidum]EJY54751.1 Cobyrinic acid ac-diamide synthase [Alicyclobacillus hesperidum URH17-3-68]